MSFITSAIGGISDKHIAEFAFVKPKKIYTGVLMKIAAAAACAAVIVTGVPKIKEVIYYNSNSSEMLSSVVDNSVDSVVFEASYVIFNGKKYTLRFVSKELPKEYEYKVVGEILSVDSADSDKEGFSDCCSVGDLIYQTPEIEDEIYVLYTDVHETADPYYMWFVYGSFDDEDDFRHYEMQFS